MLDMSIVNDPYAWGVLYLDLDGTVREGKNDALGRFVNSPADVRIFPQALARMRQWVEADGRIIGVTNQGGPAVGLVSEEAVSEAIQETARQCSDLFATIAACLHHPDARDPLMRVCLCRKPKIGGLAVATHGLSGLTGEVYPTSLALMVGDRPEDEQCAAAAGITFLPADRWREGADPIWLEALELLREFRDARDRDDRQQAEGAGDDERAGS